MINKKGVAINELLIVLVLCLTVSVILLSLILKRVNEQRFRTLKTNLDLFISSSSLYNIDNGTGIVSLKELVDTKVINPVKDPFNQSKNCDLYESRVLKNGKTLVDFYIYDKTSSIEVIVDRCLQVNLRKLFVELEELNMLKEK